LIAFATAPGSTAADAGAGGRNGLYTHHLVRQMDRPGLAIEEVFKGTRAAVRTESRNAQVPWESTSLESEFSFRAAPPAPKPVVAAAPATASVPRAIPSSVVAPPTFAVGDTWTYRLTNLLDNSERRTTARIKEIKGNEVHFANGEIYDLFGNGTRLRRNSELFETWSPSTQLYVFPLVAGTTQNVKSVETVGKRVYDVDIALRMVGEEEIEAPVGKIRAFRIERIARWKVRDAPDAGTSKQTYWYNATYKRAVLRERTNATDAGKVLTYDRAEMMSYESR
jgi:hypothetical protein